MINIIEFFDAALIYVNKKFLRTDFQAKTTNEVSQSDSIFHGMEQVQEDGVGAGNREASV